MSQDKRPQLAITLGDPAGIGPEVVLKALADPEATRDCEVIVVGSRSRLDQTYDRLSSVVTEPLARPKDLTVLEVRIDVDTEAAIEMGRGNAASGAASFRYLTTAIDAALAGQVQGIVTGPIAKSAWKAAGHEYPGQTELLAERTRVDRFGMLFVARSPHTDWMLRTLLATTHIPLRQVADALTPALLTRKLGLLIECLDKDFGITAPRIAIAGLNPHSGEGGQLGREEQEWLIPWLAQVQEQYPQAQLTGPVPPDTLWVQPGQAWFCDRTKAAHDGYLALYHDQGLIPVKLMGFDRAVNTSIGLPFVRTSPDHGTAFDIAGKGIAAATSMKAAIQLATELCRTRQQRDDRPVLTDL